MPRTALRIVVLLGLALGCGRREGDDSATASPSASSAPAASATAPTTAAPSAAVLRQPPLVSLDGKNNPFSVSLVAPGRPRVYARGMRVWVRELPKGDSQRIGYLRMGASSPTAPKDVGRVGCPGGWYPVEPRGYVCVGDGATLDGQDPAVRGTREHPPDSTRKLPYIYGTVRNPGPIYARLPTVEEQATAEPGLEGRIEKWLAATGEVGASYAPEVWTPGLAQPPDAAQAWRERSSDPLPGFLENGSSMPRPGGTQAGEALVLGTMKPRAGYAFLQTFLHQGRRYGITTDMTLMPTDRLRPIRGSDFHGYEIGKEVQFPFAIVRRADARFYIYQSSGDKLLDAGVAPYRAALALTGKQKFFRGRLHYETADQKWVSDLHASRLDPARRMPAWGKRGERWIDINLTKQTLVLYEGERAVYATLISSGEAGLEDPEHTTATKRGIFRIHTKHVTATMSSDEIGEEFELRDVPYVQYFDQEGYALHGAYWHDRFGTPKSHGCLNLSPEDARRVFYFTEPSVPVGWHGAMAPLTGTVIFIHP